MHTISANRQNRPLSAGMPLVEGVGGSILSEDCQDQNQKRKLMMRLLHRIAASLVLPLIQRLYIIPFPMLAYISPDSPQYTPLTIPLITVLLLIGASYFEDKLRGSWQFILVFFRNRASYYVYRLFERVFKQVRL